MSSRAGRPERLPGPEVAEVRAVTPNGNLTARALGPEFPLEGTLLTVAALGVSATVLRVFGPVDRPYLALRPKSVLRAPVAAALVGTRLTGER